MRCALLVSLPTILTAPVSAAAPTAAVSVSVDDAGRTSALRVNGREVLGRAMPAALVSLCDVTEGNAFVPGAPTGGDLSTGLRLSFEGAQAAATLRCEPVNGVTRFTCDLTGAKGLPARGVLLRFAFPIDCVGWRWHDDMQSSRVIETGQLYENVQPLRLWADLPEWADQPALRMGYSNRNFCTVLTGPVGLCLSVPLDRPCIFRTAYDARAKQLQLVYDLALSPDTRRPNAAEFAFELSSCDPEWGFRSALADYYEGHPDMFVRHVPGPGQWMAFNRLSQVVHPNDYYFGLQEGAPEPDYDDKLGVLSCTYFTHAGQFANIPDHNPEKDPLPPHEVQVQTMSDTFTRRTGIKGIYEQVGLHDADEKLSIHQARVYGHLIAQFNLDPDLPYGAWHLKRTAQQTKAIKDRNGGDLDGFYYDGLTAGINYRRDHFKYAEAPPLWDPVKKKPFLNNFFGACEFARAAAERLRPRGQITMMNGALHASFFVAPWLDVLGSETGLRISRENLNYIRSIVYQKPYLTLLKGNYEQKIGHDDIELFMKRALAYGIFPGFFDWPPSGLGPGGRYWDHPEYYLRDWDLHHRYVPLCRTLADAGWQPVTHARSSSERVFVERFGPADDGVVWLTLLNEDATPHETTLTIEARGLGLDGGQVQCLDLLTDKPVALERDGDLLSAQLPVEADGVALLQLCPPQQAAAWRLARAAEVVERGRKTLELEAGSPPRAVYWRPSGEGYLFEEVGQGGRLTFVGDDRGAQECSQWAMLFQPEAAPVKLTVRAAGENLAGDGKVGIRCRIAWVTSSYSHYERLTFELPKGTYDARDIEFTLECEHPLRAIHLTPRMEADVTGRLRLESIRLEDRFGSDYVEDPTFNEWLVRPSPDTRESMAEESRKLQDAIADAQRAMQQSFSEAPAREALLDASQQCALLCARLSDADDELDRDLGPGHPAYDLLSVVPRDLAVALLTSGGAILPQLHGPSRAAPGDTVRLSLDKPELAGLPVEVAWYARGTASGGAEAPPPGPEPVVPETAAPDSYIDYAALLRLGSEDRFAWIHAKHRVEIAAPLELTLSSRGANPDTGALHIVATIHNNRTRPAEVVIELAAPEGWQGASARIGEVAAGQSREARLAVTPTATADAGLIEVRATARAGTDVARASKAILHIPKEANLLRNAGFETGAQSWSGIANNLAIDEQTALSGKASVRLHNGAAAQSTVSQSVALDQKRPCPILVRAASRGENVSGKRDRGYSLYVDLYYTDGTPLYGQTYDFEPGTTDWQLGELCIEPAKPIRNVNVYLLLRGKSGTVWFDDIAVMEDPRRAGNLAREAKVTVDSVFSRYRVAPLNDGVVYPPADAHWTDESWASAEAAKEHFVQLSFAEPVTIARATVYWSLDAGIPRTSAEVHLQVKEGDRWRTVGLAKPARPSPQTTIRLSGPVEGRKFRLLQPADRGPEGRSDLMWVREVEVFAPRSEP